MQKKMYVLKVSFLDGKTSECIHTLEEECVKHIRRLLALDKVKSCEVIKDSFDGKYID